MKYNCNISSLVVWFCVAFLLVAMPVLAQQAPIAVPAHDGKRQVYVYKPNMEYEPIIQDNDASYYLEPGMRQYIFPNPQTTQPQYQQPVPQAVPQQPYPQPTVPQAAVPHTAPSYPQQQYGEDNDNSYVPPRGGSWYDDMDSNSYY